MSNVIEQTINSMLNEKETTLGICPFCGGSNNAIIVYNLKLEDSKNVKNNINQEISDVGLKSINSKAYHCTNCTNTWVVDSQHKQYAISKGQLVDTVDKLKFGTPNDESDNLNTNTQSSKLSFAAFYNRLKQSPVLLAPNVNPTLNKITKEPVYNIPENIKFIKLKNEKYTELFEEFDEIKSKIKSSVLYELCSKDKKLFVKKLKKEKIDENLYLDCVKKLDKEFELNGKLVKLVEKSENPSSFEQKIKNYILESENVDFNEFIIYINESYEDEANYLTIYKEKIQNEI
jgi:uncharacterized protein YdcH (DUF465 family)